MTRAASHGSLLSYTVGFVLSVVLTLAAYLSVVNTKMVSRQVVFFVVGLAVIQLAVQLLFFLHLGRESKPRLNLLVFGFMLIVVAILVAGSLWIMYNLDYHMTPQQMDTSIIKDEGIHL